jgi:peptide chain release factor 2
VLKEQVEDEEQQTLAPNFWDDPKKAELILKKLNQKKYWVKSFDDLTESYDDLVGLREFLNEGEGSEEDLDNAFKNLLVEVEEVEFKTCSQVRRMFFRPY